MRKSITDNRVRALCVIGFFLLPIGVVIAYLNPATGYELSIYSGTPIVVWILLGFSMAFGLFGSFYANQRNSYLLSIGLIGLTAVVFVAMPIVRGYFFLSTGDAPTHFGWAVDIFEGIAGADEYDHTGVQLLIGSASEIMGVEIHEVSLTIGLAFFAIFILVIPLILRIARPGKFYMLIGVIGAAITLPMNRLDPINFSPRIQAYLFLPLIIFFLVKSLNNSSDKYRYALLFIISSTALLTYHVEYPFYLLLVLIPITLILIGFSEILKRDYFAPMAWSIFVVAIISFWWANRRERVEARLANYITSVLIPDSLDESVGQTARGDTLSHLGSSITEVLLKLFIVDILFILFTISGVLLLIISRENWMNRFPRYEEMVYLYSLAVFGGILLFPMLASGFFNLRFYGFLMVIVTITGCIGLLNIYDNIKKLYSRSKAKQFFFITLVICLALSAPIVFVSPYIYSPTGHITESQVDGHAVLLSESEETCTINYHRSRIDRFHDMINGPNAEISVQNNRITLDYYQHIKEHELFSEPCGYISLTDRDYKQDIVLYSGLRLSESDINYLDFDPSIHFILDNGDHNVYYWNKN